MSVKLRMTLWITLMVLLLAAMVLVFAESGDPLYYLLYKAVCMDTAADKKQSGTKRENKDTGQQTQTLG